MKIVQIGAGAVAESILAALVKVGNTPIALYNRSISRAQELKEKYASDLFITNDLKELPTDADCYLFSLKDDAIALVASAMPSTKGVWLHTAAARSSDLFAPYHNDYGLFYPFNTFTRSFPIELQGTPLFIEYHNFETQQTILSLAALLGMKAKESDVTSRTKLHLAAVFACNFTNHLLTIADEILCHTEGLSFDELRPLLRETFRKVDSLSPLDAQSGPARRHDDETIRKHHLILKEYPEILTAIYDLLTHSIKDHYPI